MPYRAVMRALGAALALLLLVPSSAWALNVEASHFTLGNGLQVVVIADRRAPVVTHMVWYLVGSADEPQGKAGIAHFLEHLLFKGTTTLSPGEFSNIVYRYGGEDNAFTSRDYTAYFEQISKDRLSVVMEIEADRMANLVLTEEDVATEREVVREERREIENDPEQLLKYDQSIAGSACCAASLRRAHTPHQHLGGAVDQWRVR